MVLFVAVPRRRQRPAISTEVVLLFLSPQASCCCKLGMRYADWNQSQTNTQMWRTPNCAVYLKLLRYWARNFIEDKQQYTVYCAELPEVRYCCMFRPAWAVFCCCVAERLDTRKVLLVVLCRLYDMSDFSNVSCEVMRQSDTRSLNHSQTHAVWNTVRHTQFEPQSDTRSLNHNPRPYTVMVSSEAIKLAQLLLAQRGRDGKLPPRLLRGVRWFENDVSGLPIEPIFKSQAVQEAWILKMDSSIGIIILLGLESPGLYPRWQQEIPFSLKAIQTNPAPTRPVVRHTWWHKISRTLAAAVARMFTGQEGQRRFPRVVTWVTSSNDCKKLRLG
jgi:hypothetical protein